MRGCVGGDVWAEICGRRCVGGVDDKEDVRGLMKGVTKGGMCG